MNDGSDFPPPLPPLGFEAVPLGVPENDTLETIVGAQLPPLGDTLLPPLGGVPLPPLGADLTNPFANDSVLGGVTMDHHPTVVEHDHMHEHAHVPTASVPIAENSGSSRNQSADTTHSDSSANTSASSDANPTLPPMETTSPTAPNSNPQSTDPQHSPQNAVISSRPDNEETIPEDLNYSPHDSPHSAQQTTLNMSTLTSSTDSDQLDSPRRLGNQVSMLESSPSPPPSKGDGETLQLGAHHAVPFDNDDDDTQSTADAQSSDGEEGHLGKSPDAGSASADSSDDDDNLVAVTEHIDEEGDAPVQPFRSLGGVDGDDDSENDEYLLSAMEETIAKADAKEAEEEVNGTDGNSATEQPEAPVERRMSMEETEKALGDSIDAIQSPKNFLGQDQAMDTTEEGDAATAATENPEASKEEPADPLASIPIDFDDDEDEDADNESITVPAKKSKSKRARMSPKPAARKTPKVLNGPGSTSAVNDSLNISNMDSSDNEEDNSFANTLAHRFNAPPPAKKPPPSMLSSQASKGHPSNQKPSSTSKDPRSSRKRPSTNGRPPSVPNGNTSFQSQASNNPPEKVDPLIQKLKIIAKRFYDSITKCNPAWRRFDSVKEVKNIYSTLSSPDFYCDPQRLANCRIRDPQNPNKKKLHLFEYVQTVNQMFVRKCKEQRQNSLITECIKPTVDFLAKFAKVYGFNTRIQIYHKELYVRTNTYNLNKEVTDRASGGNINQFSKQAELTTRTIVHLLRTIGDMLKEIHDDSAIHWLNAARTIDSNAACTYLAIADYYKRKISPVASSDTFLEFIYNYGRACNVTKHAFVIQRKLDYLKKYLRAKINERELMLYKQQLQRYRGTELHNTTIYLKNLQMYKKPAKAKKKKNGPSDGSELNPDKLKDFCVYSLLGCIFFEHSIDDLCYFKKALNYLDDTAIDDVWLMKLFVVAVFGFQEFGINVWTAILAITDRNISVIQIPRDPSVSKSRHLPENTETDEEINVLFPTCSFYFLAWLGKNIESVPLDRPNIFELGTSYLSPKQNLRRLEPYLTPDLNPQFEFQNRMGLRDFIPFEKLGPKDITNIRFTRDDNEELLISDQNGLRAITDIEGQASNIPVVSRYTVLETVIFDDAEIPPRDIEALIPQLVAAEINVAYPKDIAHRAHYRGIRKKYRMVFRRSGDNFEEFYRHVSDKWSRKTRTGIFIECVVGIVKQRSDYAYALNSDQILTLSELTQILAARQTN